MQIQIEWETPRKDAVRLIFPEVWGRADFARARDAAYALAASVEQPLDVILDMQASRVLPEGAMVCGQRLLEMAPANFSRFVVLGGDKQVRLLVYLFCQIYPGASEHVLYVDEEAALQRVLDWPAVSPGIRA